MKVDGELIHNKQYKPSEVRVSLHSDRQKAGRATRKIGEIYAHKKEPVLAYIVLMT
jgi:hypothetical protein